MFRIGIDQNSVRWLGPSGNNLNADVQPLRRDFQSLGSRGREAGGASLVGPVRIIGSRCRLGRGDRTLLVWIPQFEGEERISMKVLVVNRREVQQWLSMRECVDVMADVFKGLGRGHALNPLREHE